MQDGIAVEEQQGSLEKGLAGDYSLNLKELLGEAWRRVDGNKALIWKAMLITEPGLRFSDRRKWRC